MTKREKNEGCDNSKPSPKKKKAIIWEIGIQASVRGKMINKRSSFGERPHHPEKGARKVKKRKRNLKKSSASS